jgi:hypothetical protein
MQNDAMIGVVRSIFYRTDLTGDQVEALCAVIDVLRKRGSDAEIQIPSVSHFPDGTEHPTAVAVDFDGCLFTNHWPGIGKPNLPLINKLIELQKSGCKLILYTCREEGLLHDAMHYCLAGYGLLFDAVNDNLPLWKKYYGNNPRKISADYYLDDKAVCVRAEG